MVVSVLDGLAANAPGNLLTCDPVLAAKVTVENVDGNHVVQDLGLPYVRNVRPYDLRFGYGQAR